MRVKCTHVSTCDGFQKCGYYDGGQAGLEIPDHIETVKQIKKQGQRVFYCGGADGNVALVEHKDDSNCESIW